MHLIDFIESKPIDQQRVDELLSLTRTENRWSNFGPVSRLLEDYVQEQFIKDDSKVVVACSSGTMALYALVGLQNFIHCKKLRWVTSSYAFNCLNCNILSDIIIVDCSADGMLDIKELKSINLDCYDGIIVTNVFGFKNDLSVYEQYCAKNNKIMLVDNATGIDIDRRFKSNEIISMHHTKAWGFGEGGCVVIEREYRELMRSLINNGINSKYKNANTWISNAKMSDIAAAYILQRLEKIKQIKRVYKTQYKRVSSVGEKFGFIPLGKPFHTPCNVPLIFSKPIKKIENNLIPLQKYYKPLSNTIQASRLYENIVNFPCHAGMQLVTDDHLKTVFELITNE
jgi:dTDP-4-amino-4,6-dideoxygalactose transaminase